MTNVGKPPLQKLKSRDLERRIEDLHDRFRDLCAPVRETSW